jgi:predicted RNA-binding protein YlxR (DUF448 family)
MARKHVPLRTCVQCQQVRPKGELIRIVRTPQEGVEIDERGKAAGRGAYLCRDRTCWEGAVARNRLDYALRMKLSREHKEKLTEYGEQLPYCNSEEMGSGLQDTSKKGA